MGINDGHRHKLGSFVTGKSEHQSLISRSLFLVEAFGFTDTDGDIRGLLVDGGNDGAGLPVESHGGVVIADFLYSVSYNLGHIHVTGRGNFPGNQRHSCGNEGFTGHPTSRIIF